ncbi:MAG: adenylate/guanylate cyclase domain-containing protein [Alphaproteobacteria bacterium]|nr:adenylate/guanylate cyclase domain-containing protein [Alphaproteobacteria bacterium]
MNASTLAMGNAAAAKEADAEAEHGTFDSVSTASAARADAMPARASLARIVLDRFRPHGLGVKDPLYRPVLLSKVVAAVCAFAITVIAAISTQTEFVGWSPEQVTNGAMVLGGEVLLAWASLATLLLRRYMLGRVLLMLFVVAVMVTVSVGLGSNTGVDLIGTVCLIATPFLIFAWKERVAIVLATTLAVAAAFGLKEWQLNFAPLVEVSEREMTLNRYAAFFISIAIAAFIAFLHHSAEAAKDALAAEQERSENLLLNILPPAIADRLKAGPSVIADAHEEVTILFADLVGFTTFSSSRTPEEVVRVLNKIFSAFDELAFRLGVEKIKTIGDGYMAVSGLPVPRPDHAKAAAKMALGMLRLMEDVRRLEGVEIGIRIGLHTGRVVAGVIGRRKFTYDLWGDAVNTASRMESSGAPNRVNVSEATYQILQERFRFTPRGLVAVKGKGEMACYFLDGRKES